MAITTDCAEGRHEVCRGAGLNHYCPQTAHLGDQKCACRCHASARSPQGETHEAALREVRSWCIDGANAIEPRNVLGQIAAVVDRALAARPPQDEDHAPPRPEQPPPDQLGGQPPAEPPEAP